MTPTPEMLATLERSRKAFLELLAQNEAQLRALYRKAANDVARLVQEASLLSTPEGWEVIRLRNLLSSIEQRIARLGEETYARILSCYQESVAQGFLGAQDQAALWLDQLSGYGTLADLPDAAFTSIWAEANRALLTTVDGIELSAKIWNIDQTSLAAMRQFISETMFGQKNPAALYAQMKSFLLMPNVDMRTRYWRDFFAQNPPGRGVYRSAYKNILRVIRTEANRAYRMATQLSAKQLSWVSGLQWMLSPAHPEYDVCDSYANEDGYGLGAGVYPVGGLPDSGHPHCICYVLMVPDAALLQSVA